MLAHAEAALAPVLRESCLDAWRSATLEDAIMVAVVFRRD